MDMFKCLSLLIKKSLLKMISLIVIANMFKTLLITYMVIMKPLRVSKILSLNYLEILLLLYLIWLINKNKIWHSLIFIDIVMSWLVNNKKEILQDITFQKNNGSILLMLKSFHWQWDSLIMLDRLWTLN